MPVAVVSKTAFAKAAQPIGSLLLGPDRKFSKDDRHGVYEYCCSFVQLEYFRCCLFQRETAKILMNKSISFVSNFKKRSN